MSSKEKYAHLKTTVPVKIWGLGCPSCRQETVYRYGLNTENCYCSRCKHEFDRHECKEVN